MHEQIAGQLLAALIQSNCKRYRSGDDVKFDVIADDYFKILLALKNAQQAQPDAYRLDPLK